ncbi:uncharacterized protein TNCV_4605981 [Trichonephila clavipes]|nr:uncharacterized protein TNCV_4605981 [Trichonephila clavipes]
MYKCRTENIRVPLQRQILLLIIYKLGKCVLGVSQALSPVRWGLRGGVWYATAMYTSKDALFICYKQSPDTARSVAFSPRIDSPRLIEDETFNDSDIINNLIDYEEGQEEPDSLTVNKIYAGI